MDKNELQRELMRTPHNVLNSYRAYHTVTFCGEGTNVKIPYGKHHIISISADGEDILITKNGAAVGGPTLNGLTIPYGTGENIRRAMDLIDTFEKEN